MVFSDCIVTERLILRPFVDEDKDDVFALMSDDYICKMAGIKPYKTVLVYIKQGYFKPLFFKFSKGMKHCMMLKSG